MPKPKEKKPDDGLTTEISIKWNIEDLIWYDDGVEMLDPPLTRVEAAWILEELKNNHDASIGVNWDVISHWISTVEEHRMESVTSGYREMSTNELRNLYTFRYGAIPEGYTEESIIEDLEA